jgi:hypothetical protein
LEEQREGRNMLNTHDSLQRSFPILETVIKHLSCSEQDKQMLRNSSRQFTPSGTRTDKPTYKGYSQSRKKAEPLDWKMFPKLRAR